jgi:hypothetical protein
MKLSFVGLCVAGTALAIILQTGAATPVSSAFAAEPTATVEPTVTPTATVEAMVTPTATVEPTVTPTAAPPEDCIKTDVNLHVRRCPAGVSLTSNAAAKSDQLTTR